MAVMDRLVLAARALVGTLPADLDPLDRDPAHPSRLLTGILPGGAGTPPKRGTQEFLEAYEQMPLLRMVTGRISDTVSQVQWQVFAVRPKSENGKAVMMKALRRAGPIERRSVLHDLRERGELQQFEDHPMLDLLDGANEYHTGRAVRKVSQISIETVGESFWLKERNGLGAPIGVWPIPAHWIKATPTPTNRTYTVSFRGWQGAVPDTEIFWAAEPNPAHPYARGTGVGNALADDLETDKYAAIMTKQKFFNHMRPDILITGKDLSESETRRLEQDWRAKHGGMWQQWKARFLNKEVKVHEFDTDFRSQQFVQLRQHERDFVVQVYGVPPEILGIIESSNRATIEAAENLYTRFVIVPRLEFWRTNLQERFIGEYDERLILDYVNPVPDDKEYALKAAMAAPWALSFNEWRQRAGAEPLEDERAGTIYMMPFGVTATPEEEIFSPPKPPVPVPATGPNGGPPKPGDQAAEEEEEAAAAAGLPALVRRAGETTGLQAIAERLEPLLRRAFLDAVAAMQGRMDLEKIAQALIAGQIDAAVAASGVMELTGGLEALTPVLQAGFLQGGQYAARGLTAAGLKISFDLTNPRAQAWAGLYSSKLITEITEETRAGVRTLIEQAFEDGKHPYETARSIKEWVGLTSRQQDAVARFARSLHEAGVDPELVERRTDRFAAAQLRYRSRLIARTETLASSNHGQDELWQQAQERGLLSATRTKRVWIVTEDDRLDAETCEPMADQMVGLSEPFRTPQGKRIQVPPAHPNCRCTVGLEIP